MIIALGNIKHDGVDYVEGDIFEAGASEQELVADGMAKIVNMKPTTEEAISDDEPKTKGKVKETAKPKGNKKMETETQTEEVVEPTTEEATESTEEVATEGAEETATEATPAE